MAAYVQDAIMLLGDSITQGGYENNGFAAKLAHVYNRKMDVINRGFSGYNTEWALPIFEQCFATQHEQQHLPKVRLLIIWFGANDSCLPTREQHVPLPQYKANLRKMIWMVRSPESPRYSPDTRVILINSPPLNAEQWAGRQAAQEPPRPMERDSAVTRTYAEAAVEVGAQEGVAVVDAWTALYDAAGREEKALKKFLTDGLHLNEAGYAIVYDELVKTIKEKHPEYHYDNLQFVFVPFDKICEDLKNYKELTKKRSAFPDA
ncbi:SGNH hydrolase [Polyporus arcularius HHB13444]|uniref:SGNH hydrolase n=1 Tax=Polyporus arcularius HHB13444 TaxID=1314778 RepID=A0A5C3P845_9APHY|nr:SGNH hydrolase [Polyporus arcularius HHB13444]